MNGTPAYRVSLYLRLPFPFPLFCVIGEFISPGKISLTQESHRIIFVRYVTYVHLYTNREKVGSFEVYSSMDNDSTVLFTARVRF